MQETSHGAVLTVYVQPRAAKTEYVGLYGKGALKFRIAAPPVEGAANQVLCRYLSKQFGIPKGSVVIEGGMGCRHKRVLLKGLSVDQVRKILDCNE